jgi:hypothetical protein
MKTQAKTAGAAASKLITQRIGELGDWRGRTLAKVRALIKQADPAVLEEWKWMGTPVWSHAGGICTGETYKSVVKLTFFKGAFVDDPKKLFNSSLEGNLRRAIDIHESEVIDATAFKALVRAAIALNTAGGKTSSTAKKPAVAKRRAVGKKGAKKTPTAKESPRKTPAASKSRRGRAHRR